MPYIIRHRMELAGRMREGGEPYPGEPTRAIKEMGWVEFVTDEVYEQAVKDHGDPFAEQKEITESANVSEGLSVQKETVEEETEGASAEPVGGDDDVDGDEASTSASSTPHPTERSVEVVSKGNGWYDVEVDGEQVNEKALREAEAHSLAEYYKAGEDLREGEED